MNTRARKTNLLAHAVRTLMSLAVLSGFDAWAAIRTWDGGGANNLWTTATNWVGDVAPVAGDALVFPAGAARLGSVNNFPAGTTFNSLALSGGGYFLSGSNLVLSAGISATHASGVNSIQLSIQLSATQTFTNAGPGTLSFSSLNLNLNGHDLTFGVGVGEIQTGFCSITGAGGLNKTGPGVLYLGSGATNSYTGPTEVREGTLYAQSVSALGATNGSTTVFAGAVLDIGGTFTVGEPLVLAGRLRIGSSAGTNTWTGPIELTASNATVEVFSQARADFNGVVSGSGALTRIGAGALVLNAANTYSGFTTNFASGPLVINGYQPQSDVIFAGGTLGGTGTVGSVTATTTLLKTFSPGNSAGTLTCSNLTLVTSMPGVSFPVELNGTTPGSYDRVNVHGTVVFSNVFLSVTRGYSTSAGDSFVIVNNDGTDAVVRTFSGLPEGAIMNVNGVPLQISYVGGTGNDIVLTALTGAPRPVLTIRQAPPTSVLLSWATNFAGYALEATTNLDTPVWTAVSPAPGVTGTNNFVTNAASGAQKYYRLQTPQL